MRDLSFSQLVLLIVFLVLPLGNFVLQQLRRRLEDTTPAEEKPQAEAPGQAQAASAHQPARHASGKRVHELQARMVSTPPSRSYSAKLSLLRTPHDARLGIILMTVLGPCRALDSPEPRAAQSGRATFHNVQF